jgi:hypothetical protein
MFALLQDHMLQHMVRPTIIYGWRAEQYSEMTGRIVRSGNKQKRALMDAMNVEKCRAIFKISHPVSAHEAELPNFMGKVHKAEY